MNTDDLFLNIEKSEEKKEIPIPISNLNAVIERKIFTIVTFRIYPNGQMSHPVSKSWFQDEYGTIVPKKKETKKIQVKKSVLQQEEAY